MQPLDTKQLASAQALSFDIEERTAKLEAIADWRDELQHALDAAANPFDIAPDLDWLRREVSRFRLACKGVR